MKKKPVKKQKPLQHKGVKPGPAPKLKPQKRITGWDTNRWENSSADNIA